MSEDMKAASPRTGTPSFPRDYLGSPSRPLGRRRIPGRFVGRAHARRVILATCASSLKTQRTWTISPWTCWSRSLPEVYIVAASRRPPPGPAG